MVKQAAVAATYLSGFCNPTNPDDSHRRCPGSYEGRPCACEREGCPCREARTRNNGAALLAQMERDAESVDLSGAILCGDATDTDMEQVRLFAAALQHDDPAAALDVLSQQQGQHGNASTMSLEQALLLQQQGSPATVQQHHATATSGGTPVGVTVTGERWTWEADAAAELMLEPGDCPMCGGDWITTHAFLDDGRVACL